MSTFSVVIPAAGSSTRFGADRSKVFAPLNGRQVWEWSVDVFASLNCVKQIILVLSADEVDAFRVAQTALLEDQRISITTGGTTRADSVRNGLNCVGDQVEFVAVHDAARPLITAEWIAWLFSQAGQHPALLPVVPVTSTVKQVDAEGRVEATVDRSSLRLAQTPQVFSRQLLLDAYAAVKDFATCTDEASIVEQFGHEVMTVSGQSENLKITTPGDLLLAEFRMSQRNG